VSGIAEAIKGLVLLTQPASGRVMLEQKVRISADFGLACSAGSWFIQVLARYSPVPIQAVRNSSPASAPAASAVRPSSFRWMRAFRTRHDQKAVPPRSTGAPGIEGRTLPSIQLQPALAASRHGAGPAGCRPQAGARHSRHGPGFKAIAPGGLRDRQQGPVRRPHGEGASCSLGRPRLPWLDGSSRSCNSRAGTARG